MRRDDVRDALDAMASEVSAPTADAPGAIARGRARTRGRRLRLVGAVALLVVIVAVAAGAVARTGHDAPAVPTSDQGTDVVAGQRAAGIVAPTADEAWKCRNPIEYTSDGGRTWRATTLPRGGYCAAVAGGTAWVVSSNSHGVDTTIVRLRHGGQEIETFDLPASLAGASPIFVDADHGWVSVADDDGVTTLYGTTDGGATWEFVTNRRLGALSFMSPDVGWSSDDAQVLTTVDGGHSWRAVHTIEGSVFRVEATRSGAVVWGGTPINEPLAQYRPFFDVSTDSGATWSRRAGPVGFERPRVNNLFSLTDADHWALSSGTELRMTDDAGRTWKTKRDLPSGVSGPATIAFPTVPVGWFTTGGGQVRRSADGGTTWTDVTEGAPTRVPEPAIPTRPEPIPLAFVSPTQGWICSDPMEYTSDAGVSWKTVPVPTVPDLCAAIPGGDGWALTRTTDPRGQRLVHVSPDGTAEAFAFPQLPSSLVVQELTFVDNRVGFAMARELARGPERALLQTRNGGRTWDVVYGAASPAVYGGIHFTSATVGWAAEVPHRAVVLHTTNGGVAWGSIPVPQPPGAAGLGVAVSPVWVDGDTIIAAGAKPTGQATQTFFDLSTDGGQTWTMRSAPPNVAYDTLAPAPFDAVDADHWQLGTANSLWTTADRGRTWTHAAEFAGVSQVTAVDFLTPAIGFVSTIGTGDAANSSVTLRTADGGNSWTSVALHAPGLTSASQVVNFPGGIVGCPTRPLVAPPAGDPPAGLIEAATRYVGRGPDAWAPETNQAYHLGKNPANSFGNLFAYQVGSCGPATMANGWVVELRGPAIKGRAYIPRANLAFAHYADGWQVFGRYP